MRLNSRLDSQNLRGSRIKSGVKFRDSQGTVNLPLSVLYLPDPPLGHLFDLKTLHCIATYPEWSHDEFHPP